jgi:AraC-like DNA-binding protein
VRRTASGYYLLGTTLSIQDIARALGYSSTASFNHAFNRWHGKNPSSWKSSKMNNAPSQGGE